MITDSVGTTASLRDLGLRLQTGKVYYFVNFAGVPIVRNEGEMIDAYKRSIPRPIVLITF